jgi:anhydro-N-acetylmuramic acid kinase
MSGTSMDGIDAALVDFSNNIPPGQHRSKAFPKQLHDRLIVIRELPNSALHDLQDLDRDVGELLREPLTS